MEKKTTLRLSLAIGLAILASLLFILNRDIGVQTPEEIEYEFKMSIESIDRGVDHLLEQFGIEKAWIRRREIAVGEDMFVRVERSVSVPADVIPAVLNREISLLARRHRGRAVATESLRENSVTIHIMLHDVIVQTIILRVRPHLQRKEKREHLEEA